MAKFTFKMVALECINNQICYYAGQRCGNIIVVRVPLGTLGAAFGWQPSEKYETVETDRFSVIRPNDKGYSRVAAKLAAMIIKIKQGKVREPVKFNAEPYHTKEMTAEMVRKLASDALHSNIRELNGIPVDIDLKAKMILAKPMLSPTDLGWLAMNAKYVRNDILKLQIGQILVDEQ